MPGETTIASELAAMAAEQGFPLCGITTAQAAPNFAQLCRWLDAGYGGTMDYIGRRRDAYRHPKHILPEVRSLIMLGMPYQPARSFFRHPANAGRSVEKGKGEVAAYATGEIDYHDLIRVRLKGLARWLEQRFPSAHVRGVVDTAPLLEREFAILAGLGWRGKNTLVLNRTHGSYFFLAALLTDIEFDSTSPPTTDHCGTCRACLDACPTQAFPEPYVLNASQCISYWTIEHRGTIPREATEGIGDWLFGCDVCQQVCPWNRKVDVPLLQELIAKPDLASISLLELLGLDEGEFKKRYRPTPLWRARWAGIQRNAMIVLGNQRYAAAVPTIQSFLSHPSAILRRTAAWSLGQIGGPGVASQLQIRRNEESDPEVIDEIDAAVNRLQSSSLC